MKNKLKENDEKHVYVVKRKWKSILFLRILKQNTMGRVACTLACASIYSHSTIVQPWFGLRMDAMGGYNRWIKWEDTTGGYNG